MKADDQGQYITKQRKESLCSKIKHLFKNWTFKIKWLIKADDDVAINAELLAEKLTDLKPFDQIYCHIRWFAQPNRKEGSKW